MNFLYPPFDNPGKIRRAAFMATINQKDFMDAMVGNDKYFVLCGALFVCGIAARDRLSARTVLVKGNGVGGGEEAAESFRL